MRRTIVTTAAAVLALGGLAACGGDSDEGFLETDDDGAESIDSPGSEQPTDESGPVPDAAMPDDVTLTLREATVITWGEVEDAVRYEVEVDGETLNTVFDTSVTALGTIDGEITVDSPEGPAPDVRSEPLDVLVVEWTEEPGAIYYVEYTATGRGTTGTTANSPFIIDVPPEEVEAVRFGPAVLVTEGDEQSYDLPFDHGDDYFVDLPLP